MRRGQAVVYVTERAVFRLTPAGVTLIEVAPGIDPARDVIAAMEFEPRLDGPPATIDPACYAA